MGRGGYEGEESVDGTWIEEMREYVLLWDRSPIYGVLRSTGTVTCLNSSDRACGAFVSEASVVVVPLMLG